MRALQISWDYPSQDIADQCLHLQQLIMERTPKLLEDARVLDGFCMLREELVYASSHHELENLKKCYKNISAIIDTLPKN